MAIFMKVLVEILKDLRPDVDFDTDARLVEDGILESLDIVVLVGEIADKFDVEISVEDLLPENFNSKEAIMKLINRNK